MSLKSCLNRIEDTIGGTKPEIFHGHDTLRGGIIMIQIEKIRQLIHFILFRFQKIIQNNL